MAAKEQCMLNSQEQRSPMLRIIEPDYEPETPCEPTDAMPGSYAKIDVLAARAQAGMPLWHPLDPVLSHNPCAPADWIAGYRGQKHDLHIVDRRERSCSRVRDVGVRVLR